MQKKCLVCESVAFEKIYNDTLLKCSTCGFVTANMDIDVKELEKIYTENYFTGEEYVDYVRDKQILQTNFSKRLKRIDKIVGLKNCTNALEIGCAYGFFAELFTQKNPTATYIGYDIVPEAINYGKEQLHQPVYCEDYLSVEIPENSVTDVFMWDVIEHLPNPELFIEKIAKELKSGGRIYITTGDIERFVPRFKKEKWRMIHPPSHLHYFSKNTLKKLLEKNGFELVEVTYPPIYRSIRLIFFSLFMLRKKPSKFIEKIYSWIPERANIALNTYDILFLVARKK
jgi:2-polyprenyl-3-methyl-5-hydroxy-6-metoxy-1,4-benzoquinol methylase